jgi:uncharacterized LabA/DUF88 family protein
VDTEMGFDLAEYQEKFDHLVLFSGDGDFYYPLEKLINKGKSLKIYSTQGHISGLINLTHSNTNQAKYVDFNHSKHPEAIFLRTIIKDTKM